MSQTTETIVEMSPASAIGVALGAAIGAVIVVAVLVVLFVFRKEIFRKATKKPCPESAVSDVGLEGDPLCEHEHAARSKSKKESPYEEVSKKENPYEDIPPLENACADSAIPGVGLGNDSLREQNRAGATKSKSENPYELVSKKENPYEDVPRLENTNLYAEIPGRSRLGLDETRKSQEGIADHFYAEISARRMVGCPLMSSRDELFGSRDGVDSRLPEKTSDGETVVEAGESHSDGESGDPVEYAVVDMKKKRQERERKRASETEHDDRRSDSGSDGQQIVTESDGHKSDSASNGHESGSENEDHRSDLVSGGHERLTENEELGTDSVSNGQESMTENEDFRIDLASNGHERVTGNSHWTETV